MSARPALFPLPEPDIPALSEYLAGPHWRLLPGEKAKWTRINVKTIDCGECAHLQHECGGAYGPRRQAKRRRVTRGARLDLCRAHAQLWEQRDEVDTQRHHGRTA